MLDLVCAHLVGLSLNCTQENQQLKVPVSQESITLVHSLSSDQDSSIQYLAKGRYYESEYRRQVDRHRRRHEINNHRDRYHRDDDDRYRRGEREYREDRYRGHRERRHHNIDWRREHERHNRRSRRRPIIYRLVDW